MGGDAEDEKSGHTKTVSLSEKGPLRQQERGM